MRSFVGFAEGTPVKNFSDDFCGLCNRHSGTVEEQIPVRKSEVTIANRLKLPPPWMSLQDSLFPQAPLQVEAAGRNDQVLRVRLSESLGGNGG
jgi:hypothetical protein